MIKFHSSMFLLLLCQFHYSVCYAETANQRFDGWYNNLANPHWGSTDSPLMRLVEAEYEDSVYQLIKSRPNPRHLSNKYFSTNRNFTQQNRGPNTTSFTALFAYFCQLVNLEIYDFTEGCPLEQENIKVPRCDREFDPHCTGRQNLPFTRAEYIKSTGHSENSPRALKNVVTAWIDGSVLYGNSNAWSHHLRLHRDGLLRTSDSNHPASNNLRLPLSILPSTSNRTKPNHGDKWVVSSSKIHENPALLAIYVTWYRYHNHVARELKTKNTDWSDEQLFMKSRGHVVAVLQNVVMYEWLPTLLAGQEVSHIGDGSSIPEYTGYNSQLNPNPSPLFTAAASNWYLTLLPDLLKRRQKNVSRICNTYWNSQEIMTESSVDSVLLGLINEPAAQADRFISGDLRKSFYGPYHHSRTDLISTVIMNGRDSGLPSYQKASEQLQLPFTESIGESVDVFVGGMLETKNGRPGLLFSHVIKDQFLRLRDGDRYWFENRNNGLFTDEEIEKFRATKFKDVLSFVEQKDVFMINRDVHSTGKHMEHQRNEYETGEECHPLIVVDYFDGNELVFVTSFVVVGLFPISK